MVPGTVTRQPGTGVFLCFARRSRLDCWLINDLVFSLSGLAHSHSKHTTGSSMVIVVLPAMLLIVR